VYKVDKTALKHFTKEIPNPPKKMMGRNEKSQILFELRREEPLLHQLSAVSPLLVAMRTARAGEELNVEHREDCFLKLKLKNCYVCIELNFTMYNT
jgi:hypothetical protein